MFIEYVQEYVDTKTENYELEVDSYILRKCLRNETRDILGKEYQIDLSKESTTIRITKV